MTLSPELLQRLKSAPPREVDLQRSTARLLDYSGLLWCHVPNEQSWMGIVRRTLIGLLGQGPGTRAAHCLGLAIGKYNQSNGLKAGVPDVMVFEPFKIKNVPWRGDPELAGAVHYNGLALELKAGKNKSTAAQKQWHERLQSAGWKVAVCYSLDEALKVLRECYPNRIKS
jgi:hypothetical protein